MDNNREFESVWATVQRNAGGMAMAVMLSARMSLQLLTFLYRMAQKGLLATSVADNFKNFSKLTEGKFTVYNIPLSQEHAQALVKINELENRLKDAAGLKEKKEIEKEIRSIKKSIPELQELEKLNVSFCVLPKLNGDTNNIQLAVADSSAPTFKNWYLNHLTNNLSGGQKGLNELQAFTEGNCTIYNLPMEGEELQTALSDFDILGINYAILPDLNVGDGNTQISVANADQNKVGMWAKMWKDKQLAEGKEAGEIYRMDADSYLQTGNVDAEDYINGAEEKYRAANQEFEEKSVPVPWNGTLGRENSEEFASFMKNDNYEKITINRETLVDKMGMSAKAEEMQKNGYFISRIPQTFGAGQKTLLIPCRQVFETDDGKTYIAFLEKNAQNLIVDEAGHLGHIGMDEIRQKYDPVGRGFKTAKSMVEKSPEAALKKQQIPAVAAPALKM